MHWLLYFTVVAKEGREIMYQTVAIVLIVIGTAIKAIDEITKNKK